ncbi:hypothetical protein Cs7R123_49980 [Catellatospora sp. TT07R-123]|nr:hypothetical protein Cs7R123_49980 [Catellatospora sp. TT07R-123]
MELSGSCAELRELAGLLRAGAGAYALDAAADPAPYGRALGSVRVERTSGLVELALDADGQTLRIRGAAESLAILAGNFEAVATEPDPHYHVHIEYFPDHMYLAETSDALILIADS